MHRTTLSAAVAAVLSGIAPPALAQPISLFPSAGSRPVPVLAPSAPPRLLPSDPDAPDAYLVTARIEVLDGRTAAAREALERAETRMLDTSTLASAPACDAEGIREVQVARAVLVSDRTEAVRAIDAALAALTCPPPPAGAAPPVEATVPPAARLPIARAPVAPPAVAVPASPPSRTYALLAGRWKLHGAKSVWVPPDTRLRQVFPATLVVGEYVWHDGAYVWVPTHYAVP